jgi:hypothetical protein
VNSIAIMQPYFLPYLGYWKLMNEVDTFVVYRDIKFSKGGWINRNQLMLDGKVEWFTIPLNKANDAAMISDRQISSSWPKSRESLLRRIDLNYKRSEFFEEIRPWMLRIFRHDATSLSEFLKFSILETHGLLALNSTVIEENEVGSFASLKGQERVLAICEALKASHYLNPQGGKTLYSSDAFLSQGVQLAFQEPVSILGVPLDEGVAPLSILDTLANLGLSETRRILST